MDPKEILLLLVVGAVALPLILIAVFVYHATVKAKREKRAHARITMFSWLEVMGIHWEQVSDPKFSKSFEEHVMNVITPASLICAIRIRGQDVDLVKLEERRGPSWYDVRFYVLRYVIEKSPGKKGEELETIASRVTEGGETDIHWAGRELAQRLKNDQSITDSLLLEFQGGLRQIWIKPSKKRKSVEIQVAYLHAEDKVPSPSKHGFEAYNRIATHIRDSLSAASEEKTNFVRNSLTLRGWFGTLFRPDDNL